MSFVPCNGCTACCHGPVVLHPALGDDPTKFDVELTPLGAALKRKPDGSCIYVGDKGCSIWPNTPAICRAFDCRAYALTSWAKSDPLRDEKVIARGEELLKHG